MEMIDYVEEVGAWQTDGAIAGRYGVSVDDVRNARSKLSSEFKKKEGRRWLVSPEGVERIGAMFVQGPGVLPLETEKNDAGGESDAAAELFEVIAKKIPANPHLLLGEWMGTPVRVRVRDSRKFVPGMRLKCRLVEGDIFALVGRGPRFKGRW